MSHTILHIIYLVDLTIELRCTFLHKRLFIILILPKSIINNFINNNYYYYNIDKMLFV